MTREEYKANKLNEKLEVTLADSLKAEGKIGTMKLIFKSVVVALKG